MEDTANKMTQEKLWTKAYVCLLGVNVLSAFSFYMTATVLISFLTDDAVGMTAAMAGVISGMFSITSFICRPMCGVMSDRMNKVRLLQIAAVMMSLGCFGYTLPAGIGIIILMRVIHGAGFAVNSTAVTALTAEKIPMSKMGEGIGYMGLANVIASAAAPGIGISISEVLGYKAVFYISGILGLVTMAIFCTFREKGKPRIHLKKKLEFSDILAVDVLGYTLIGGIFSFTNGVISAYLLMYAQAMGIVNVGLYFTVNAVVMFLIRPAAGKLMDRHGLYVVAFPGLVVTAASMILLAQAGSFGSLALGIIIISGMIRAVGQGAVNPALQTQCIHKLGIAKSGVATSTFYLGGDIGQGLGPMAAGAMIGTNDKDPASYKKVFYMCTVLLIAAVFILMRVKKKDIQNDKKSR